MKKGLFLCLALVALLFTSCVVNSATGAVTIINYTNRTASHMKLGNYYVGTVRPGGTMTSYFFTNRDGVKIFCQDFDAGSGYVDTNGITLPVMKSSFSGTIDLKTNYRYIMRLRYSDSANRYYIEMVGTEVGQNSSSANKIYKQ